MKLSISTEAGIIMASYEDRIIHCGIQILTNECIMIQSNEKNLTIISTENGFKIKETSANGKME